MTNWFRVGKVVNTHGVTGEVRVISSTDFEEERYTVGSVLYLEHDQIDGPVKLIVEGHRKHKNFDLLRFKGWTTLSDAERLKGGIVKVSENQLTDLEDGEFYYHEIVGCAVFTEEGEELGKVKEILSPGANDVWVVQRKGEGKDLLIPYIEDVVKEVSIDDNRITIHLMDGLLP